MLISKTEKMKKESNINILKLFKGYFTGLFILLLFLMTSCEIFEKEPLDAIQSKDVWNSKNLATLYLNSLYNLALPVFSGTANSNLSDESPGGSNYMYGELNNESVSDFSNETYAKIRRINILLEEIEQGTISTADKQVIIGQAIFLRAWIYWNLVRLYGGVPMVMKVQQMSTSGEVTPEILVRRNTTKECIEILAAELDTAFKYLPVKWDDANYGRITRGAALALKGRILLFWASPQFNPANKIERWQWAYDVNKMAIDTLTKDGHGLHSSFKELFNDCMEKTKEAIFVRVYDAVNFYHAFDNAVRPKYEGKSGGGSNNATWNHVQAYPMVDGYPVTIPSAEYPYNKNRFWVNRDPRFNFTIAYNTCYWPLSGQANYRLWTYYHLKDTSLLSVEVVEKKVSTGQYTSTGFYCRKYVNPVILKERVDQVGTDWMEIRFAELLLNLAECANETGEALEARNALSRIRNERTDVKVGMAYINENIDDIEIMREIIMTERQVELAFENKRHWDLRRRNMFENDLGPNIKRLNGTRRVGWKVELNEDRVPPERMQNIRDDYDYSIPIIYNAYFKAGYEEMLDTQYPINYPQPQYNFYAIPQTNIDKNPVLEQTNFWGGAYDPLAE